MKKSTRSRLTEKQIAVFPGNTLFDKIARAVCRAGNLPGKELFEAWEVARRVRRKFRGGRVVDLACGHGLLAHIMLLLDDSSAEALAVDLDFTVNTKRLSQIIIDRWPHLENRIYYLNSRVEDIDLNPDDIAVSVHACGRLMQEDEASTIRTLEDSKRLMTEIIEQIKGRVADAPGDNLLAEFGSVVDATECAVKIQQELKTQNDELPENRRMDLRIGINLGDVVEEVGRIYGDGVNI